MARGLSTRLPAILLAAAALCFFLPFFAGVACEERVHVTGIDLATGTVPTPEDESGEPQPDSELDELVARMAGPPAALAFGAALAGALFGLVRRRAAPSAAVVAGGLAFGALAALYLDSVFMLDEGEQYDGFWLALALSVSAVAAGALVWPRRNTRPSRAGWVATMLAVAGIAVLLGELVVRTAELSEPPLEEYFFWSALVAVGIPVGVLVVALLLRQQGSDGAAAGLLLGTGLVALLHAVTSVGLVTQGEDLPLSTRGVATVVVGSLLILLGGLLAALAAPFRRGSPTGPLIAVAGAALIVIAATMPYDGGGDEELSVLAGGEQAGGWLAVLPLGVAVAVVMAALLRFRADATLVGGMFVALGGATALFFFDLLYPLFGRGMETSFGPGGVAGLIGAALVVAGGAMELWSVRPAAGEAVSQAPSSRRPNDGTPASRRSSSGLRLR